MDLWQALKEFFMTFSAEELVLTLFGLTLIACAFIKSSFGFFSFLAWLSLSASLTVGILEGGGLSYVFIYVFFVLSVISVMFVLSARFSRYGWINRSVIQSEKKE
jgi:hypothetical protein